MIDRRLLIITETPTYLPSQVIEIEQKSIHTYPHLMSPNHTYQAGFPNPVQAGQSKEHINWAEIASNLNTHICIQIIILYHNE